MKTKINLPFTSLHRLLHWALAGLMSVLFLTGFLRMYWMSKNTIIAAVESATQRQQISMERESMLEIAKSILSPMWQWHELAAYLVLAAFAGRIVYMFLKGIRFPNPFSRQTNVKERLQGGTYMLFYLLVAVAAITGFYLKWESGEWKEPMEMLHKLAIYWLPAFLVLHFAGIWIAERLHKGVSSRMIGGG